MSELSTSRSEAFVLCVIEGMSPSEAAEVAGCSALAMRARLFDARRELQARCRRDPVLAGRALPGALR